MTKLEKTVEALRESTRNIYSAAPTTKALEGIENLSLKDLQKCVIKATSPVQKKLSRAKPESVQEKPKLEVDYNRLKKFWKIMKQNKPTVKPLQIKLE
ncbi:25962_t:CDS:2, partial [Gigaspora margarita]